MASRSREIARVFEFLLVGGVAFLVDAAVYNLLVFGPGAELFGSQPIWAKVIAIAVATGVSYIGNLLLTYRDRGSRASARSVGWFLVLNGIASLLQLACLAFSRYVLDLDDIVADNIFGTVLGQVLATIFRYITYPRFVYRSAGGIPVVTSSDVA